MQMPIICPCGGHESHAYFILSPERIKKDLTAFLSRVVMLRSIAKITSMVWSCYDRLWRLMQLHLKNFTLHWHFQILQWVFLHYLHQLRLYDVIIIHIINALSQILRCRCGPQWGLAGTTLFWFLCNGNPSVWVGRFTLHDPWFGVKKQYGRSHCAVLT